jgi:hypothetical protein
MNQTRRSRRAFLRGAGVALSLPFLETLAPRPLKAQSTSIKRYIALYFPNGTAAFWKPNGEGSSWTLSPLLAPFESLKSSLTVLSNVSNYAPFGGHVEPSHSNLGAATWTCVKPNGDGNANSGTSIDQLIAAELGAQTHLPSLQVGLSTLDSYTDGLPGQHSRSISWKAPDQPLYKTVNPQAVFDRLFGDNPAPGNGAEPDPAAERRRALKQSALDYVLEDAQALQRKLSKSDRARLDQFLTSARSLEKRVAAPEMPKPIASCAGAARPAATFTVGNVPEDYNRNTHAELMIDLVVLAIECDVTRVVSFMLDDARSDFTYDFLQNREFSDTGSEPGNGKAGGYHGAQHAGDRNNGFATIGYWNSQKAAQLAQRLRDIDEGDAGTALDNSVITFASGMNGGNHDARELPIALLGGGGKLASGTVLKTGQHLAFPGETRLADVHLTLLREVFGSKVDKFGASSGILSELLT